jgi:hypothetical protein
MNSVHFPETFHKIIIFLKFLLIESKLKIDRNILTEIKLNQFQNPLKVVHTDQSIHLCIKQ